MRCSFIATQAQFFNAAILKKSYSLLKIIICILWTFVVIISSLLKKMSVNINLSNNRLSKARRIVNGSVKGSDLSSKNVKIVHFVRHAQVYRHPILLSYYILYICSYASEAFEQ